MDLGNRSKRNSTPANAKKPELPPTPITAVVRNSPPMYRSTGRYMPTSQKKISLTGQINKTKLKLRLNHSELTSAVSNRRLKARKMDRPNERRSIRQKMSCLVRLFNLAFTSTNEIFTRFLARWKSLWPEKTTQRKNCTIIQGAQPTLCPTWIIAKYRFQK